MGYGYYRCHIGKPLNIVYKYTNADINTGLKGKQ